GRVERDFGRVEVVDAGAGRAIQHVVRRPFFGIGGVTSLRSSDYLEYGIYPNQVVWIYRGTPLGWIARKFVGIDAATAIGCRGIDIDAFLQVDRGSNFAAV